MHHYYHEEMRGWKGGFVLLFLGGKEVRTVSSEEPGPEAQYGSEDYGELFESEEGTSGFWRADFGHVQRREHTVWCARWEKARPREKRGSGIANIP